MFSGSTVSPEIFPVCGVIFRGWAAVSADWPFLLGTDNLGESPGLPLGLGSALSHRV